MTYLAVDMAVSKRVTWRRSRLRHVGVLTREKRQERDIPLLSLSVKHGVRYRGEGGLGRQAPSEESLASYWVVHPGDVVVNPMWLLEGSVGVTHLMGAVSPAYRVYRPHPDTDGRFLAYLLSSRPYIEQYQLMTRGLTTFDRAVQREDLDGIPVSLPTVDEQRQIADFLDAETARTDKLHERLGAARELLNERRRACVHDAVTGLEQERRRPVDLAWTDSVPSSWPVVPLKYVARYGSGHTPSRTHPEYWVDCEIPWISLFDVGRMRDLRMERIHETTQMISRLGMANSSACLHPADTVVLSRTASVGFATIMGIEMAVSQHFATWTCGPRLLPEFLLHVLRAMKQTWESLQVGTTNVTVFMPDLLAVRVPVPPLEEQGQIVKQIVRDTAQIDAIGERIDRQRVLLTERRIALVTAAVTGDLDVLTARGVS